MRLIDYIEKQEENGKLWFTKTEALQAVGCTETALNQSIHYLIQKSRLARIKDNFILIVPLAYKNWGIIPADWFIDSLMKSLGLPYYISTLSAAEFYGAAHQKPMQFQVVTSRYLRDIKYERIHIHFIQNKRISKIPIQRTQVQTGYAVISTPEATAFDLCKYYAVSGYWSNIATILSELLESIDADKLCQIAASNIYETPIIQRLGFVLSHPDVRGETIAEKLYNSVNKKLFRWIALTPKQNLLKGISKDNKWKIFINEEIEGDI
jgi:predicted transcriptional regulator of viral defense system